MKARTVVGGGARGFGAAALLLSLLLSLLLGVAGCGGGQTTDAAPEPVARKAAAADESAGSTGSTNNTGSASAPIRKAIATRIPVYRFYNTRTGAHFYTTSESEKNTLLSTMPQFNFDGTAFLAASDSAPGLSPVYRFYNTQTGVHFYTISEAEKASIQATRPQFQLEGVAYYASPGTGQGLLPLYRFYVPTRGFHFYTASPAEKDALIANTASGYSYEGIGYYVMGSNWNPNKLPHTGLTTAQCYGYDNNTSAFVFATCTGNTVSMSFGQDSARTAFNPMSYSTVRRPAGMFFILEPLTNCVYDNVTGLVWEGKTDDGGLRDKDNNYTNWGNNAAGDASGHVAAVNAANLCGYNDWRLPTTLEMVTLVNYSSAAGPSYVDANWLVNMPFGQYWSREVRTITTAWAFYLSQDRWEAEVPRGTLAKVRLVRGSMGNTAGGRYSYISVPYGTDAANNVVNDQLTGLQWRRCLEGQVWNGTACTGTYLGFTHVQALAYAENPGLTARGWRLPNVKEGASLLDKSATAPPYMNTAAFPVGSPSAGRVWTSTAYVVDPLNFAYDVSVGAGYLDHSTRSIDWIAIRLVR
ncbi:DUF1566 domain-containing protein [Hydrogenophaga sp. MI9]|uniref:DUF1566 domain-containing protein n=1 Tax=Hydrogenophaga sp. MI9 TaxID=3453719 RepID=UPI003EEC8FFF